MGAAAGLISRMALGRSKNPSGYEEKTMTILQDGIYMVTVSATVTSPQALARWGVTVIAKNKTGDKKRGCFPIDKTLSRAFGQGMVRLNRNDIIEIWIAGGENAIFQNFRFSIEMI